MVFKEVEPCAQNFATILVSIDHWEDTYDHLQGIFILIMTNISI